MDGHGWLIAKTPVTLGSLISFPECGSRITGLIPKKGTVAEPGLVGIAPGKGELKYKNK